MGDMSYNKIKDVGVQTLVGAMCKGAAPNLEELRMYKNEITHLGEVMLTQGLQVFRKKLKIVVEEPDYSVYGKKKENPTEKGPEPAVTSAESEMDLGFVQHSIALSFFCFRSSSSACLF